MQADKNKNKADTNKLLTKKIESISWNNSEWKKEELTSERQHTFKSIKIFARIQAPHFLLHIT